MSSRVPPPLAGRSRAALLDRTYRAYLAAIAAERVAMRNLDRARRAYFAAALVPFSAALRQGGKR
jgi:hypothetical protein